MNDKQRFLELCRTVQRDGMDGLISWLEESDFYVAPASSRHHSSCLGGLLKHSLNVYDEAKRILKAYPEIKVSEESVIVSTLFHDLCKVNFYAKEKRNRKNELGQWESYDTYVTNEKFCFGGHGSKSLYLLHHFISLSPEEAVAINCHMSTWEDGAIRYVGKAFEQYPLAWVVHVADEAATFLSESKTK